LVIALGPSPSHGAEAHPPFDWRAESNVDIAYFGISVASAGDVNGDGYSDVIVGAYGFQNFMGKAYLYLGSATGLSSDPSWTAVPDQPNVSFGFSVASAGDVNADGYDDVVVGAYNYSHGQVDEGRAFLYLGSATGPSASPDWTAEPDFAFSQFGISVGSAGDVNGDGYDDVVVGADQLSRAYLYVGSSTGLGSTAAWTATGQPGSSFGHSVASAGDVNGDGYGDVVVGAQYYDDGQDTEGGAFAYLGSPSGLASTPAWSAESNQAGALFGASVASAGDVNADGYADVLVGAPAFDDGQPDRGRAALYLGSAAGLTSAAGWTGEGDRPAAGFGWSVASAGDMNGDGYDDAIISASTFTRGSLGNEGAVFSFVGTPAGLGTSPSFRFESGQENARAGSSVASAGDANGDGLSDSVAGIYYYDHGQVDEGAAVAWYGEAR
jgi:hypothetical protein